ncbi:helix-turn-helix transcriptional regulator (plasmid) [Erythrobacteraceae bacterium WH01K]|nr:helix-turn-helix transcriptional regulator [Erythrobacteraceae bacterium WH01K]
MSRLSTISHIDPKSRAEIGQRLKAVRTSVGEVGETFAQAIGTSQASLSGYENGKNAIPIRIVLCLCETYQVDAHWLLLGRGWMIRFVRQAEAT